MFTRKKFIPKGKKVVKNTLKNNVNPILTKSKPIPRGKLVVKEKELTVSSRAQALKNALNIPHTKKGIITERKKKNKVIKGTSLNFKPNKIPMGKGMSLNDNGNNFLRHMSQYLREKHPNGRTIG